MNAKAGKTVNHLFLLGSLIANCGAGVAVCQWKVQHYTTFSHRAAIKRIPSSFRPIPVDTTPAPQPTLSLHSAVRYSLGDRLKITLFGKVDLSVEEQINIPATGLVERTELTGDYILQENGYIVLPPCQQCAEVNLSNCSPRKGWAIPYSGYGNGRTYP